MMGLIVAGLTGVLPSPAQALTLRVGVPQFQPDVYLDSTGHINGILGRILSEIAKREGWTLKPKACDWAECLRLLQAGSVDLLPDVTYTPERVKTFGFHHTPVSFRSFQLFTRAGTKLDTLSDLGGKRLAVLSGAAQQKMVESYLSQHGINTQLMPVNKLSEGFKLVQEGQADAVVADDIVGTLEASKHHLIPVPVMLPTASIFYATARGRHPEVLARIDHYLNLWKADPNSVYFEALAGWSQPVPGSTRHWYAGWMALLLIITMLLAATGFVWRRRHRTQNLSNRYPTLDRQDRTPPTADEAQVQVHATADRVALPGTVTELPNRNMMVAHIEQALTAAKKGEAIGAVLVLDIDNFRKINDTYGVAMGDKVLKEVAQHLAAHTRPRDIIARTNGDEFTLLLTRLASNATEGAVRAVKIAEKLRRILINVSKETSGSPSVLGISVGVTLLHEQSHSATDALREAGLAMHKAEEAGGNQVVMFGDDLRCGAERRLTLETDLALAIRSLGITVFLQPQYSRTDEVTGVELLARWCHPLLGPISPAEFIPLARDIGELDALTDSVLEYACRLAVDLERLGEPYPISMNISPGTLMNPLFFGSVRRILDRTGTAGSRLIFEVTEDIQMDGATTAIQHMKALGELGVRFSMDDFGMGYSNLANLQKLPLYELKIDKSLVDEIHENSDSAAVVGLILAAARQLGLRVVAEGVEAKAQAEFLFGLGCDAIQGYLMARPMPVEEWLTSLPSHKWQ